MSEKLTNLPVASSSSSGDKFYIVQDGESKQIDYDNMPSGGSSSLEFQTEITATTTVFDGSQKGDSKVYPFNRATAQTVQIDKDDYAENDVINIERRGQGTLQVIQGTDVRFRGVRDINNEFFVNDANSMVALLCRGSNEFTILGNLKRGYTGAVTTTSYSPSLQEGDTNRSITVIGTGFSDNMLVTVSANATLNSFTVVSNTELTLNLDAVGDEDDTVTITYDNGDIYVDTDALTITSSISTLFSSHPFEVGYALFMLKSSQVYALRVRRSSDDAETDVGFNGSGKVALDSPISAGGDLTTWAGSDDVYMTKYYNQGSGGSTFDQVQATPAKQAKFLNAGALITQGGETWIEFDGTNDEYQCVGTDAWVSADFTAFNNNRVPVDADGTIIASYIDSDTRPFYLRYQASSNKYQFWVGDSTGSSPANVLSTAISLDTNYQLVSRINSTDIIIYLDGVSGATASTPALQETESAVLDMGSVNALGSSFMNGYLNYSVIYLSDETSNISDIETILNTFL